MLIKNHNPHVMNIGGHVQLLPGVNHVDNKAFAEAEKLDTTKHLFKTKKLEKVAGKESGADLRDFSATDAMSTVEETYDEKLLAAWGANETRPEVRLAISNQEKSLADPKATRPTHEGIAAHVSRASPAPFAPGAEQPPYVGAGYPKKDTDDDEDEAPHKGKKK